MNLAIIGTEGCTNIEEEFLQNPLNELTGKDHIERLLVFAHNYGIKKVVCILNTHQQQLENLLCSKDYGVELKVILKDTINSMHSLFELTPYMMDSPLIITSSEASFQDNDFAEFINYSIIQEGVDGVISVIDKPEDNKPLCVSMNEEDIILRFSDSREGYNWAAGKMCYFSPSIFNEIIYEFNNGVGSLRKFFRILIEKGYVLKGFSFSRAVDLQQ